LNSQLPKAESGSANDEILGPSLIEDKFAPQRNPDSPMTL